MVIFGLNGGRPKTVSIGSAWLAGFMNWARKPIGLSKTDQVEI
jgi:hypothetical protein